MAKTYEMMWDCSYCDTKKLLGQSHKHCPNCGTAQDPTKRYFPPDDEKVAVEDHQFVGKDKVCGFCEAPNSAFAKFCTECAGPMDGTKDVALVGEPPAKKEQPSAEPKKKSSLLKWIGIVVVVLIVIIAIFSMEEEKGVEVTGHSWTRNIEIEKYKQVSEEDWEDKVPSKGKIRTCTEKQRDTEKVADGEECSLVKKDNGDGTYNETEQCQTKYKTVPIYDDWCTYEIKKWTVVKTEKASAKDLSPVWPDINIQACQGTVALNCEREGSRKDVYTVHLKDEEGKEHSCDFPENKWKGISVGTNKVMAFGTVTGLIDCDSWDQK